MRNMILVIFTSIFCLCHYVRALTTPTPAIAHKGPWMTRVHQLLEFQEQYGHVCVPKRYKDNPGLGNWVNKQRQQYRNFMKDQKPCSLTAERIEFLNQMGFCWNAVCPTATSSEDDDSSSDHPASVASSSSSNNDDRDDDWWITFRQLQAKVTTEREETNLSASLVTLIPRQSHLGKWLQKQRTAMLTTTQVEAFDQLDIYWKMTYHEWLWEQRYRELQEYQAKNGDCCVPIGYNENRPLAHWVSNQRKLYNKKQIPPKRLQKLNVIGFVWNRWEHEFEKKTMQWAESK